MALLLVPRAYPQRTALDLNRFGLPAATISHCDEPLPIEGFHYVGDDLLLITFVPACTNVSASGPLTYTAILLDHRGDLRGKLILTGSLNDIEQTAIPAQPSDAVLFRTNHQIRVYDVELQQFTAIDLPDDPLPGGSLLRVTPDRTKLAVFTRRGNFAQVAVTKVGEKLPPPDPLDFDERAAREGNIQVSNQGDVAHAVDDPGSELGVHSWISKWPQMPKVGKFDTPLTFVADNQLLLSSMSTRPFPPTYLYLWASDGRLQKVSGAEAEYFGSAETSADGRRALLKKATGNFIVEMFNGFDCGGCGDSYSYLLVDIPSAKVVKEYKPDWKCTEALSPSGREVAELCGDKLRFIPTP